MAAPYADTVFTIHHNVIGIRLSCPECDHPLRCEDRDDYRWPARVPELVYKRGPLGFMARCDVCGFRVEMKGNRLPTVQMMAVPTKEDEHG